MGLSKIVYGVAVLLVVVLLFGTVLVPVVGQAQGSFSSKVQNENFDISYTTASAPTFTIAADGSKISVGDYELSISNQSLLVVCEEFDIFAFNNISLYVMEADSSVYHSTSSVVITDGVAAFTSSGVDYTISTESMMIYPSKDKIDRVGYSPSSVAKFYISNNGDIYSHRNYNLTNPELDPTSIGPIITFKNGEMMFHSGTALESASITYIDVVENQFNYEYDVLVTIEATNTTGTYTSPNTVSAFSLVPLEYIDRTSTDDMYSTLIGIVPILIVIVAILLAVGLIGIDRRD